jgi:uncharacterized iron-regulated membrane protein
MKRFRSVLFWIHLVVGLSLGVVILLMSVTGVLLTYQRQIQWWADTRGLEASPPYEGAAPLPAEDLLARVEVETGEAASEITWRADPEAPVALSFGRLRTAYISAYTGEVLGEGSERSRRVFRAITEWHRWLGMSGEDRAVGRAATGAANLGFLFLVLSGLYLWWPRNWRRKAVRNVTVFRRGLSAKARDFNWHNVIGFWSALPLAIVVASGVLISYSWANDFMHRMVGAESAESRPRGGGGRPGPGDHDAAAADRPSTPVALEPLLARAMADAEGWRSISLRLPVEGPEITFVVDRGNGPAQRQLRSELVLDAATGAMIRRQTFADAPPGQRLRNFIRFGHTGEVFGVLGQTVAGLVSAGAAVLVWTGLALAWRRFLAWRRRSRRAAT